MEESSVYQAIMSRGVAKGKVEGKVEGRVEEALAMLLRVGRRRFGQPPAEIAAKLQEITDVGALEEMAERLLDVSTWVELLD